MIINFNMKVRRRLSDFPKPLKIFKAVSKGCSTVEYVDYVNHIDELMDCVIQAYLDNDNDYYVIIENFDEHHFYKNSTRFSLTDKDLFTNISRIFNGPTSFSMVSFNLIQSLRHNSVADNIKSKETYETFYGKLD